MTPAEYRAVAAERGRSLTPSPVGAPETASALDAAPSGADAPHLSTTATKARAASPGPV
ncbi:MAG: hypothetical protein M3Y91_14885 [Actinomycetota bacterium]|nr:hypothetical protein [Actinomycetota bacterium]